MSAAHGDREVAIRVYRDGVIHVAPGRSLSIVYTENHIAALDARCLCWRAGLHGVHDCRLGFEDRYFVMNARDYGGNGKGGQNVHHGPGNRYTKALPLRL